MPVVLLDGMVILEIWFVEIIVQSKSTLRRVVMFVLVVMKVVGVVKVGLHRIVLLVEEIVDYF
jgi:hypothetical protein